jgi:uncharacterized protein (DUF2225 family)
MQADMAELDTMVEVKKENDQNQALLYFAVADYFIAKTSNFEDESSRATAWKEANEMRWAITGEKPKNNDSISPEQILEYQKLTGISFTEFVQNNKLNQSQS